MRIILCCVISIFSCSLNSLGTDFPAQILSLPDWAREAATGEAPHPRHVHQDNPGVEAHAGGAVAGQLLQHTVHILHRRHPHDLVRSEQAVMNDLESCDNNDG